MSQSNALRFDDLTEDAATIADASLIVRARFVEAADTMLHIDVSGIAPARLKAFWPEHIQDYNEIKIRYRPSSEAISRAEEVMYGWMIDHIEDDERRIILSRWSLCMAAPHIGGSFRTFCKETGRSRSTAERRIIHIFSRIAEAAIKIPQSLQAPNWSRVMPMMPNSATDLDKVRPPAVKYDLHEGMKPNYDPNNPDHVKLRKALIKRLERGNRRRRAQVAA
jgi:hypothetical protein